MIEDSRFVEYFKVMSHYILERYRVSRSSTSDFCNFLVTVLYRSCLNVTKTKTTEKRHGIVSHKQYLLT